MHSLFSQVRNGLGFLPRRKGKSVFVVSATERSEAVARTLAERFPRVRVIDLAGSAGVPLPWGVSPLRRRFLRRAKVRLVISDGPLDDRSSGLVDFARHEGVEVVDLAASGVSVDDLSQRLGERLAAVGDDRPQGLHGLLCRLTHRLGPTVETVEALRRRLGAPGTILCLGNGPSSETPSLAETRHDALFRVNHMWSERGLLVHPDVVFTGLRSAIRAVSGRPVFIAQTVGGVERLALMRWAALKRFATATAATLGVMPRDIVPTNGAVMLAVAVALEPKRLVIAGMDLFRHPEGAYPGDGATANAYAPLHDPDAELDFILGVLDGYDGELEIVGEALSNEWDQHVERRDGRRGPRDD